MEAARPSSNEAIHRPGVAVWPWCVLAFLSLARPSEAQWTELRASGDKDTLWVTYEAASETGGAETRVWIRRRDRGFSRPRVGSRQPPGIRSVAALGPYLHLFLQTGSHYRIGPTRVSPQLVLPDRVLPRCLAGDTPDDALYAIAEYREPVPSSQPTTRLAETQPTTTTRSRAAAPQTSRPDLVVVATEPARRWALFCLKQGRWEPTCVLPAWYDAEDQHWLCASEGVVHLFGLPAGLDAELWYRQYTSGKWLAPETIPLPRSANPVAAMVVNTYLVLVAWAPPPEGQKESKVVIARRVGGQWGIAELRRKGDGAINLPPERFSATGFTGKIALVGQFADGEPLKVGFWSPSAGGTPEGTLEILPRWPDKSQTPFAPQLPQAIVYLILAGVILLTLWRRQDSLVREIPLPEQVVLASIWRRLAAFIIDIAPVLAITSFYWVPVATKIQQEIQLEGLTDAEKAQYAAAFLWPWLVVRVLYALYCGLTEYRWGASPGKRLMQCWVVSVDMTRPTPKQIAIRNVLKVLELQHEVIALLVFVVLTRNHQRLGDVLAGTIVIEPATAPKE
ncbi:MAG: RDD family protein [Phycisphaerae bacterium]|nr:RDD family protein [Phycisphaerae bacterium]